MQHLLSLAEPINRMTPVRLSVGIGIDYKNSFHYQPHVIASEWCIKKGMMLILYKNAF